MSCQTIPSPLFDVDSVAAYLALVSPAWQGQTVLLEPSHLALEDIDQRDLTVDLLSGYQPTCV